MKVNIEKIKAKVDYYRQRLESVLRLIIIPGFEGVPLYDVLVYFIRGFTKVNLVDRAAAVAFNVFLALFPMILFLFTLIPYLPLQGVTTNLLEALQEILPPGTYESVANTIKEIMSIEHGGLMSIGLLLAFYFSTSAVSSFFRGFNMGDKEFGQVSFIKEQLYSILVMIMFVALLLLSIVLMTMGQRLLSVFFVKIHFYNDFVIFLINLLRWLIAIFALIVAMSLLYHFGDPRSKKFKLFTPGTLLFTGLFIVGTLLFNFYISNISTYNVLYGSIGGLIIFVMWIYFNCILILVGYELNKSIAKARINDDAKLLRN
ncbi:MAG: YihY/virulence factor BrkB family protein [Bacteroidales bacterium]|nr:YihY/virulence factor BrkB family protein [Lentimicrobiaceae bacterium]MBQ2852358.1 YihY/virulence factor BrkB family protein [Bacteroidales bacterium]MBR7176539.1 YihY/virulence factor BrkB family protein [Bacteroidales bacterium]